MNEYKERLKRAYSQYISSAKPRNTCQLTFMECLVLFLHYFLICWLFLFRLTLNVRIIEQSKIIEWKSMYTIIIEFLSEHWQTDSTKILSGENLIRGIFLVLSILFKGFLFFRILFFIITHLPIPLFYVKLNNLHYRNGLYCSGKADIFFSESPMSDIL